MENNKVSKNSFYHLAANYSVLSMLAAFLLNIMVKPVLSIIPVPQGIIEIGIGLLFISAIPAGVVALCGMGKYGVKGLLIKGLAGIIVPILLTLMAIPAFLQVREYSRGNLVDKVVSEMSAKLPVIVDDGIRFDRIIKESDQAVVAEFTLIDLAKEDIDVETWDNQITPLIRANVRNSSAGFLIKQGVKVTYRYHGKNGAFISDIHLTRDDLDN